MRDRATSFFPPNMPEDLPGQVALRQDFEIRAKLIRNRTRGKIGEVMATTIIESALRDDVVIDKMCFQTEFGLRRLDCFYPVSLTAIESKNCYVCASSFVRRQIAKDGYLLKNKICNEIIWAIFKGVSAKALELLKTNNITVRVGWEEIVPRP